MKILLAEDTEDSRIMLEMVLKAEGYEVMSAVNGIEALNLAQKNLPDLIISDIMMPEMDGFELCRLVKSDPELKKIPFVFYTATYTEHQDEKLAIALGASRFLIKPLEPQAFMSIIKEILSASQVGKLPIVQNKLKDKGELEEMYLHSVGRKLDKKVRELEQEREALKKNEKKYRHLVEAVQNDYFFYVHDSKGIFTYLSPSLESVLGYKTDEFLVHYSEYLTDNPVNKQVEYLTELCIQGKEQPPYEVEIVAKDGSLHWLEIKETPLLNHDGKVSEIEGVAHDITARKQAEVSLERSNRALHTLSAINETLIHATDEQKLLNDICHIIVETGLYQMVWVGYIENNDQTRIIPMASTGQVKEFLKTMPGDCFSLTEQNQEYYPWVKSHFTQNITVVNDIQHNSSDANCSQFAKQYGSGSSITLPLNFGKSGRGMLNIYAKEINTFYNEEIRLLSELSDDLAFGIKNIRMRIEHQQSAEILQQALMQTIQVIANTLEQRDPYTAGHQRRVADLAVAIAVDMGLNDEDIKAIRMGAMIHDIGKIHIPAEILNRPGKLSNNEFAIIKTHAEVGYNIIKEVDFHWPIAQMIRQHHERLNGTGYPDGLTGESIKLEARILMVADVVEAMASHRPYREGLGIKAAIDEISNNRGFSYDSDVVDACVKLFNENSFSFAD